MSTHFAYACITHDPALTSGPYHGDGGLNHGFEALCDAYVKVRRGEWPQREPYENAGYMEPVPVVGATGQESNGPVYFLYNHPRCDLVIYSEYGDAWRLFEGGAVHQIAGEDERRVSTPIRDARGMATGEHKSGEYPPEGESRCTCIAPVLWVTHPSLNARGVGWVRCKTCGGLSLPEEREG